MPLSQGDVCLSCPGAVELGILLPHLAGVVVEGVVAAAGLLLALARVKACEAACPACGAVSGRVHSRYARRLADAAVGGRRVVIRLTVRRFFCPFPDFKRGTFAEQVPGLTARYGRKTAPLAGVLRDIAVALAGRAGSRLAAALGAPASRQVLLRLAMAAPDPQAPAPRVLGVDDFAIRRGQNYGTVIIDCETGAPLDLLEGRDGQPLAGWLAAHPGVEVICRDRSGSTPTGRCPEFRTASEQVRAFAVMITQLTGQDLRSGSPAPAPPACPASPPSRKAWNKTSTPSRWA